MKKAKEMFKFFTVPIIIIIIVSVAVAVSVILAPSFWFLTINDGQWEDAELGNPSNYTENVSPVDQGGLVVDKDAIIKAGLKGLKLTDDEIENMTDEEIIDKLEINKKLKKDPKVTSLDDVTQAEILWCISDVYSKYLDNPEQLEKLLNAEIITQYPDMGQTDAELNGIIKFERHKNDGTSKFLTYIDSDTFSSYVNSNDEKALDYFTLDEQGNAVVAYLNVTTETLTFNDSDVEISNYTETLTENNKQAEGSYKKVTKTILTITINYKSVVEKYTMPFNYLWSLLVIGEDPGFVLELADLVENSEITISIYDNITTTRDENVYTYKKETRTDKYARLFVRNTYGLTRFATQRYWLAKDSPNADGNYSSRYPASYNTDPTNYIVTHTIITERNDIKYDLTKADVWIYYYSKEYAMPKGEIQPIVNMNSVNQDDTEYVLNSKTSRDSNSDSSLLNDSEAVSFAQSVKEYIEKNATKPKKIINGINGSPPIEIEEDVVADVQVSYVDIKNYDHKIERVQTQTVTTTEQRYVAQTPISRAKDDKNADEDNFVTILCKSTHQKAKDYLTDGTTTEWLWDILEVNAPDMIDLTKYLFYRVTGHNFGVKSYDFSIYESSEFSIASNGIKGGSIQEKVWFMLKDLGYSDIAAAGAMGNIHYESGSFNPNSIEHGYTETTGGIGICQWTNNNRGNVGRNTNLRNFAISKGKTWQDEDIQVEFLRGEISRGGGADGYATYQLMNKTKYYGSSLATPDSWENANSVEDATMAFCYSFERPRKTICKFFYVTKNSICSTIL